MATCGACGNDFPTCYMDTVSICPKRGTTFWNDSPSYLSNIAGSSKMSSTKDKNNKRDKKKK